MKETAEQKQQKNTTQRKKNTFYCRLKFTEESKKKNISTDLKDPPKRYSGVG